MLFQWVNTRTRVIRTHSGSRELGPVRLPTLVLWCISVSNAATAI